MDILGCLNGIFWVCCCHLGIRLLSCGLRSQFTSLVEFLPPYTLTSHFFPIALTFSQFFHQFLHTLIKHIINRQLNNITMSVIITNTILIITTLVVNITF